MADQVVWQGASGTKYTYFIHKVPANINPNQPGNYIFAKVVNNLWIPIYIGEGDLGERTNLDQHHKGYCIKLRGATHVHMHTNAKEADRRSEESDLLGLHTTSYEPTGCNEKLGG